MNERIALLAILVGILVVGYFDGQDQKMAEKYAQSQTGQQLACLSCAGGVR